MDDMSKVISDADDAILIKMVVDSLRRTMVHYGCWFSEVEHQLGMDKALAVEKTFGGQVSVTSSNG